MLWLPQGPDKANPSRRNLTRTEREGSANPQAIGGNLYPHLMQNADGLRNPDSQDYNSGP